MNEDLGSQPSRQGLSRETAPFPFEGLETYELALEVAELADDLAMEYRGRRPWLARQIGRAGLSVMNNVAEAAGESSPGDKGRFYRYALRSASEVAGMVVFLVRKELMAPAQEAAARRLLVKAMKTIGRSAKFFRSRAARARGERSEPAAAGG